MVTMRCTHILLKYLGVSELESPAAPTAKLGDWYANLIPTAGGDLIMCASEKTLLTVAIPAQDSENLAPLFRLRVGNILAMLGINADAIERELTHYEHIRFSKTASRSVLGSMNDFAQMYQYKAEEFTGEGTLSLSIAELDISNTPCKPLNFDSPDMVVRELFHGKG